MAVLGLWEALILLLASTGGVGLPLGIPPAEEDPRLANVAPEKCTFYLSWAGMAEPDPESKNQTEQLLAEPELQRFIKHLDRAITAAIADNANDETQKVVAETVPTIVKAILTKPGAAFVGEASLGIRGIQVDGGLVVNTGEETENLKQAVARLEAAVGPMVRDVEVAGQTWKEFPMPEQAPRMLWGFQGTYMILGIGEDSVENILQRVRTDPPAWLTELRERLPVPRRSTVMHLNVRAALAFAMATAPQPEIRSVVEALGLSNVKSFGCVTGLNETGFVSRTLVSVDGKPKGLFAVVSGEPLSADDLAPIPKDSTFAVAARVDLNRVFEEFRDGVNRVSPDAREELDRELGQAEKELRLKLKEDILEPLGDCWRVYNSPSDGGLLFTGLTVVVSVRDRERVVETLDKIERRSIEEVPPEDPNRRRRARHVVVRHFEFAGKRVYFLNSVGEWMPFAPAWCVTDDELIISLFPSHVKSYLSRGADFESIAAVPEVAARLADDPAPVMLGYQNTRELFQLWYPIIQIAGQFICSEAQRNGVDIDISMLPSAAAITPHLAPSTVTLTHRDGEIELTGDQSVPMSTGPLPMVVPFVFGVSWFRLAAREMETDRMIIEQQADDEAAAAVQTVESVRSTPTDDVPAFDEPSAPPPEAAPVPE
jgi:hypothetical protein